MSIEVVANLAGPDVNVLIDLARSDSARREDMARRITRIVYSDEQFPVGFEGIATMHCGLTEHNENGKPAGLLPPADEKTIIALGVLEQLNIPKSKLGLLTVVKSRLIESYVTAPFVVELPTVMPKQKSSVVAPAEAPYDAPEGRKVYAAREIISRNRGNFTNKVDASAAAMYAYRGGTASETDIDQIFIDLVNARVIPNGMSKTDATRLIKKGIATVQLG
jgi:hypothetical protein